MRTAFPLLLASCTWIDEGELADRLADSACADCGRSITEKLPDTTTAEMVPATSTVSPGTLVAQDVGLLSDIGLVDTVQGTVRLDPGTQGWGDPNDTDAFGFQVPTRARVQLSAAWPDTEADLDFGIWFEDEDLGMVDLFSSFGPGSCLTADAPPVCVSDYVLEPEVDYALLALGYLGTEAQAYTITLTWLAP